MTIAPGTRLGPYEIRAKLSEGGMGEVDRAHDTNLTRDDAIKLLPAAFTEDKGGPGRRSIPAPGGSARVP